MNFIQVVLFVAVIVTGGLIIYCWKFLKSICKLLQMLYLSKMHEKNHKKGPYSYIDTYEANLDSRGPLLKQFVTAETGEVITGGDLEKLANQVGNWGLKQGTKQLDTIAILMFNTPDYVGIWLGFGKIGASSALLNTNLTGNALIYSCELSLKQSETKILIVDIELKASLADEISKIEALGISVYFWSANVTIPSLKNDIIKLPSTRIDPKHRDKITCNDALLFIFTSGTTGLPKACKISQTRYYLSTIPYRTLCELTSKDRIYTVLPLYHSAAGLLGVGAALASGATMVLRKKFSASNFTSDCLKFNITSFQYIGELCRYLVAAPANKADSTLKSIRSAYGNGMRPDVWLKFKNRYNIAHIVEFYGATEGNASLFNNFDQVGALGFVPRLLDPLYPLKIIRTEQDDQTKPLRDASGRCIECAVGEVGLLVSQIFPTRRFDGYTDAKATNDKILRDVLKPGDTFFNTGDLLSRDAPGFYYWSDRIGDTFRWKGENVATTEVSAVLATCVGVKDCTVYGVNVPGCDGKAGMGVIAMTVAASKTTSTHNNSTAPASESVATPTSDDLAAMLSDVTRNCKAQLAPYSRPLFLRVKAHGEQLLTTTTFKHIKTDLVKEGFDPSLVGRDWLFFFSAKQAAYLPLTAEVFNDIQSEKLRF